MVNSVDQYHKLIDGLIEGNMDKTDDDRQPPNKTVVMDDKETDMKAVLCCGFQNDGQNSINADKNSIGDHPCFIDDDQNLNADDKTSFDNGENFKDYDSSFIDDDHNSIDDEISSELVSSMSFFLEAYKGELVERAFSPKSIVVIHMSQDYPFHSVLKV